MGKYILLADPDENNLQLQVTTLKYFYSGSVLIAQSSAVVRKLVKENGSPELALIDFEILREKDSSLYTEFSSSELAFPIVATSTFQADDFIMNYPQLTSWIVKPLSMNSLSQVVKSLVQISLSSSPSHVSVDIKSAVRLNTDQFDYFLRLSGKNYVKIVNKGQSFTQEDADKLLAKGITEIHISASDSFAYLKLWQASLEEQHNEEPSVENSVFALKNLEQIEAISKALHWTPEVVLKAKDTVKRAIAQLSKNEKIIDVLNQKMKNKSSSYATHVSMLAFLSAALATELEGGHETKAGDGLQMKLAMASLLHDLAVDESHYENIDEWDAKASNLSDRSLETIKYRLHPFEAAKLAQSMDTIPPDVDRIVMQHQEKKDGTGFPRGLAAQQISYLSSYFIIMEDLVDFLAKSINTTAGLRDFLTWGDMYYDQGNFKKVFQAIRIKLILE